MDTHMEQLQRQRRIVNQAIFALASKRKLTEELRIECKQATARYSEARTEVRIATEFLGNAKVELERLIDDTGLRKFRF